MTSGGLFSGGDVMGSIVGMLFQLMITYAMKSFNKDSNLTAMQEAGKADKPKEVPSKEEETVMQARRSEEDKKVATITKDGTGMEYDAAISRQDAEKNDRQLSSGMSMG